MFGLLPHRWQPEPSLPQLHPLADPIKSELEGARGECRARTYNGSLVTRDSNRVQGLSGPGQRVRGEGQKYFCI